jgi:hypothetical protein
MGQGSSIFIRIKLFLFVEVENIENANNTHIKQTKNDRTSKCQQILPQ